jgi:hypothetical protein
VYLGKKELAEKILSEEEETTLETDMNTKQNKVRHRTLSATTEI